VQSNLSAIQVKRLLLSRPMHRPKVCQRCSARSALASRPNFSLALLVRASRPFIAFRAIHILNAFSACYTSFAALLLLYTKDAIISVQPCFMLDNSGRNIPALTKFFCTKLFANVDGKAAREDHRA